MAQRRVRSEEEENQRVLRRRCRILLKPFEEGKAPLWHEPTGPSVDLRCYSYNVSGDDDGQSWSALASLSRQPRGRGVLYNLFFDDMHGRVLTSDKYRPLKKLGDEVFSRFR